MSIFRKSKRFRNVRTEDAGPLERFLARIRGLASDLRDLLFLPKGDHEPPDPAEDSPEAEALGGGGADPFGGGGTEPPPPPDFGPSRKRPLIIAALVLVAGATLFFLMPWERDRDTPGADSHALYTAEGDEAAPPGPFAATGAPEAPEAGAGAGEAEPATEIDAGTLPAGSFAPTPDGPNPTVLHLPEGIFAYDARDLASLHAEAAVIERDGTISQALEQLGIPRAQANAALSVLERERLLPVVRPGDAVKSFYLDASKAEGSLLRLEFYQEGLPRPTVLIPGGPNGFIHYSTGGRALELYEASEGTVKTTFWNAGLESGLDPRIIMALAELLASQIDFVADVRPGDNFQLLFRARYEDGILSEEPRLEMIQFTNRDRTMEFYRQDLRGGTFDFFDDSFHSIRKNFLVSPLQYKRITSGFSNARLHPILKRVRPHHGVDYAAPTGTPVSAVADGEVTFAGSKGGYGTTIVIRHDVEDLQTLYAHLSRIEKGIRPGTRVSQGQLIGYVGSTGLSTGPHLDFRLRRVNGEFLDPEAEFARLQGKELPPELQVAFAQTATSRRERLHDLLAWSTF
jgi:murein DD-endopeptidase MepM/ murein hydrolase activator NlpD